MGSMNCIAVKGSAWFCCCYWFTGGYLGVQFISGYIPIIIGGGKSQVMEVITMVAFISNVTDVVNPIINHRINRSFGSHFTVSLC